MYQYTNYQQPWQTTMPQNQPPQAQPVQYHQSTYAPPVYCQQPVYYQPAAVYAPPFAINDPKTARISVASKAVNQLGLFVLLQTVSAILFEIPLLLIMTLCGSVDSFAMQWLSTVMVPLSTALPFFVYLKIGKKDVTEYLHFKKVGFTTALLCVLAGFAVCLLGNFPAIAVQSFFGNFGYESNSALTGGSANIEMFALEFFCVAVLVPVMEEFAFRGVLMSALKKFGTGFAVVASALIFGLVHLDFPNVIFATIAGLVFGFLYAKTENLWVTIVIHALNNGVATIGTYSEYLFGSYADLMDTLLMFVPVVLGIGALVLLLIFKREKIFGKSDAEKKIQPFTAGESATAIARAPVFWIIVAIMAAYTTVMFF